MQRRIETIAVEGSDEFGRLGKSDADESLHVRRTARKQLAVALHHRERIGVPTLTVHRHDVGMAGKNQSRLVRVAQGRKQIRLLAGRVVSEPRDRAEALQIIAHPLDQPEVGVARHGLEADQPLDDGARRRARMAGMQLRVEDGVHDNRSLSKPHCTSAPLMAVMTMNHMRLHSRVLGSGRAIPVCGCSMFVRMRYASFP